MSGLRGAVLKALKLMQFRQEGIDYDLSHPKERWRELIADARYLGNSAYPRLKRGLKWGEWTLKDVFLYFAKIMDALRSIYFPLIPPFPPHEKLYEKVQKRSARKAQKSSFWQCYKEAEKFMKVKPPATLEEVKEWDKKREAWMQERKRRKR